MRISRHTTTHRTVALIAPAAIAFVLLMQTAVAAEPSLAPQARRNAQAPTTSMTLPPGTRVIHDIAYGRDTRQRFDAYLPADARRAPVIVMVHGGGWAHGDKRMPVMVGNKARWWLPKGYVFISVNYRMLPDTAPLEQARDVARALAKAQQLAASWGADRSRFVLMGHSAGAHLVALLAASPQLAADAGAAPALGAVVLDSGALDVEQIMRSRHFPLYDRAFGSDPDYWRTTSPYQRLSKDSWPMFAVCSTRRAAVCPEARTFAAKAATLGVRVQVLGMDLSHRQINEQLGEDAGYTASVDAFLRTLGL